MISTANVYADDFVMCYLHTKTLGVPFTGSSVDGSFVLYDPNAPRNIYLKKTVNGVEFRFFNIGDEDDGYFVALNTGSNDRVGEISLDDLVDDGGMIESDDYQIHLSKGT